jgi:hypothetical protein
MAATTAISNDIRPAFAHIIRNRTGMISPLSFPLFVVAFLLSSA